MPETKIPISHIVTLIAQPMHLSDSKRMSARRAEALLAMAKSKAATMQKLRALLPLAVPGTQRSDDEVIHEIATEVGNGMLELDVNIGPARTSDVRFATLLKNYPTNQMYPTTIASEPNIWKFIGGKVLVNATTPDPAKPGNMVFENSCAIRMSRALNYSDLPVHHSTNTVSGSDHKWYLFRVQKLEPEMTALFGRPTKLDLKTWRQEVAGKSGVLQFSATWSNATGHFALWTGSEMANGQNDEDDANATAVNGVQFWAVP